MRVEVSTKTIESVLLYYSIGPFLTKLTCGFPHEPICVFIAQQEGFFGGGGCLSFWDDVFFLRKDLNAESGVVVERNSKRVLF